MVSSPCSPPLVARGFALERPLLPRRSDVTVPQPAFSVTALVEVTSLPAAACRQRSGAAMSTSLGSNTYNRQNWEDAVSGGGRAEPGEPGRAGLGWWGPSPPRERVERQGREARGVREAGLGAGTFRGDPLPSLGTRCLPWGPATCAEDPPPALEPPGRPLPRFPGAPYGAKERAVPPLLPQRRGSGPVAAGSLSRRCGS